MTDSIRLDFFFSPKAKVKTRPDSSVWKDELRQAKTDVQENAADWNHQLFQFQRGGTSTAAPQTKEEEATSCFSEPTDSYQSSTLTPVG